MIHGLQRSRQLCGTDCLAHVPLGVFSYVGQQADHGGGQMLTADRARMVKSGGIDGPHNLLSGGEGAIERGEQFGAARAGGFLFGLEFGHLGSGELATLKVAHQTSGAAGDVAKMETHGTQAVRRGPNTVVGKPFRIVGEIFAGLLEGIKDGSEEGMDARDGPTQPGFR